MPIDRKTFIVVNPNSANGSTRKLWPEMEEKIRAGIGEFDWEFTKKPKEAIKLTRKAIKDGYEMIVGVGGDGTNNEVLNGFFEDGKHLNPDCAFGFICRGTGGDFRKTFGWGTELDESIERLKNDKIKPIDIGHFTYHDHNGNKQSSYFINITSFGMSGLVDHFVNTSSKALGGKLSFLIGSLKGLLLYKNQTIRLRVDDEFDEKLKINIVSIANGRFFGGGMMMAPDAEIDDGLFDVVIMGDLSKWELVSQGSRVYSGSHLDGDKVRLVRGKKIIAESDDNVLIDMDGEQPGRLPCEFEILHKALLLKG